MRPRCFKSLTGTTSLASACTKRACCDILLITYTEVQCQPLDISVAAAATLELHCDALFFLHNVAVIIQNVYDCLDSNVDDGHRHGRRVCGRHKDCKARRGQTHGKQDKARSTDRNLGAAESTATDTRRRLLKQHLTKGKMNSTERAQIYWGGSAKKARLNRRMTT